jgi:hypothetical protein
MTRQELAQTITQRILKNLSDRRGFRHLLESIELEDSETYQEIVTDITSIIENAIIHWEN